MIRMPFVALLMATLIATPALATEPIEGKWLTREGTTASIAPCGPAFCITLIDGKYAGKTIGTLTGSADSYSGEVVDPTDDKTYSGSATLRGDELELKGCVLLVLCKGQTWTRVQ